MSDAQKGWKSHAASYAVHPTLQLYVSRVTRGEGVSGKIRREDSSRKARVPYQTYFLATGQQSDTGRDRSMERSPIGQAVKLLDILFLDDSRKFRSWVKCILKVHLKLVVPLRW